MIRRLILMTSVITISSPSLLAQGMPLNDYVVPTNSVVATPVGYEKRVTLDTGETVRMYPDHLSTDEDKKCCAVLFCILSPDALRGKYFLYNNVCPCRMCRPSGSMTEYFKIGCHYSFYAPDTITNVTLIAFELGQPGGPYTMDGTLSDRLYCSTAETDQRLRELDAEASEIPRKIQELRDELSRLPNPEQLTGERRRTEMRKLRFNRAQLEGRIYGLQERLTNGIPYVVSFVKAQRDRLLSQGGAITNRVEPDRLCWNEHVRKLACCKLPSLAYHGATLNEILEGIGTAAVSNGVQYVNTPEIHIRGSAPSLAKWTRKYDIVLPEGSAWEMYLKVGTLPDVSMNVTRKFDWRQITYSVPGGSPFVDWSASGFSSVCPKMELKDVTASEAMGALYNILTQHSSNCGLIIHASVNDDVRHSFCFTGKTLRTAIAEVEQMFGVVYNYRSGVFFDPQTVPVLGDVVKLQLCEKTVWSENRAVRRELTLDAHEVKMLNDMLERCDVKCMDYVCCDWFLQEGDPVLFTYRHRFKTFGILTDNVRKEVIGFDLGSDYGNSRDSDSRQRHYVRVLRHEEDRRKIYSCLRKINEE